MSSSRPRVNASPGAAGANRVVRSQSVERLGPQRAPPKQATNPPATSTSSSASKQGSSAANPTAVRGRSSSTTLTRPAPAASKEPIQSEGTTRQPKLSAMRFDSQKSADPFAGQKKHKTNFGVVYSQGGIPCRINHGGVHHKLQWDKPISSLNYNPLFVTFAEGLLETEHPYSFVAKAGFKEMCQVEDAPSRITPLVSRVVPPIRMALMSKERGLFETGMESISLLSGVVGPAINEHLNVLLVPISKKIFEKDKKDAVMSLLQELEQNGGPEALKAIKSKVPTYVSVS